MGHRHYLVVFHSSSVQTISVPKIPSVVSMMKLASGSRLCLMVLSELLC